MIKVAFVINYIVKNGPSSVVLNIIKNLDRIRFEPTVITLFEGNDEEIISLLKENEVKVYECKTLSRMKCILGVDKEFQEIAKEFHVLHTHGLIPDMMSARVKGHVKKVSTIHSNMFEDYLNLYGSFKSKIYIKMHLKASQKLDKNICCSKSVYDAMKKYVNNPSYICNGIQKVDVQNTLTKESLNIPSESKVFLYAGAFNTRKNVVWLIKNFAKYHNNEEYLIVLGSGEFEKECLAHADDHVIMLGFKPNPLDYMAISDVYTSASKSEGFSISILEALSQGMGLFLSDIPSHREVFKISEKIYVGEYFKEIEFESALKRLRMHELDKEQIRRFQEKELSAKSMTEKYQECYREGL